MPWHPDQAMNWGLALCLGACSGSAPHSTTDDSAAPVQDSADEGWSVQPVWTAGEAAAQVEESLSLGFPDPLTLLHAYQDMMAHGDDTCPGDASQLMDSLVGWQGCTSDSGYFFSGVAAYTETETQSSSEQIWGFHLDAGFLLIDDLGAEYEAGGNIIYSLEESLEGPDWQWTGQVEGTWVQSGDTGWLDAGVSASLSLGGSEKNQEPTQSVSGTLGMGGSWLAMESVRWDSTCGVQPQGTLGIRDPSGLWLWTELGDDCTGCGVGTWDGTGESEEICIDLEPVRTVLVSLGEVDPWS